MATITGVLVSLLPHLEIALRISSLLVGLTIGIITLYRMIFWKNKSRNEKEKNP